jgi:hypothetical protein
MSHRFISIPLELVKRIVPYIESAAQADSQYGGFHGGNPNDFCPDAENTEQEHAAWKAACEAYNRGDTEYLSKIPGHTCVHDEAGKLVLHVARNPFGYGVMNYTDPEASSILGMLHGFLATDGSEAEAQRSEARKGRDA